LREYSTRNEPEKWVGFCKDYHNKKKLLKKKIKIECNMNSIQVQITPEPFPLQEKKFH
jgi:hypothetical protein